MLPKRTRWRRCRRTKNVRARRKAQQTVEGAARLDYTADDEKYVVTGERRDACRRRHAQPAGCRQHIGQSIEFYKGNENDQRRIGGNAYADRVLETVDLRLRLRPTRK